ncbi:MAG: sulfocyanin-like copper-binding protein [Gemmatimonadales bacterium]
MRRPSSACRARALLFAAALTAPMSARLGAQTPSTQPAIRVDSAGGAPASATPSWFAADDAARTVTIALQVTRGPDGVAINGAREGGMQIVVPLGWSVHWDWRNADSTSPHSLVAMVEREKLPMEGGHPAFSNAMTRMVSVGLAAGQGDRTTFTAEEAGWYWLLCGVPEHAIAGEYLGLRIDPEAKTASVKRK